ncbi:TRIM2_3 [Mytilus edulis]|uniref:TRIM2_3 n=1 Tax=Mytilus edulis TaxID=6550 RepID=A0A8S3V3P2_MYTED|nr:TRIM2_3 [Mytilus edulis]
MRKRLDKHLDTLEENLLQELSSKAGTCETEINNSLSEIESKTKAAYAVQSNITLLKTMATDVQLFLAIRDIDTSVTTETNWLREFANQHNTDELTLDLNTKPMEDILITKSLGSVRIDCIPNHVPINHLNMKEAQIPREAMCNGIDQIQLYQKIHIQYHNEKTVASCWGISCDNGQMAVKLLTERINLYDTNGLRIQQIKVEESCPHYINDITIAHRHIYYSHPYQNSVFCLGLDGTLIWKYESDFLQHPRGVTTDGYGNVYVVGRHSKNLIVISKDGQNGRELLKCNVTPWSVHFDKHYNKLFSERF